MEGVVFSVKKSHLNPTSFPCFNMLTAAEYDTLTITQATQIQRELRDSIQLTHRDAPVKTIAGADLSFNRFGTTFYAGIVILSFPELKLLSYSLAKTEVHFPYVPGFLAFREIPALLKCWEQILVKPDVLVADGHGIAHPRRMGIAAHFGVITGQATMGCAKKLLFGHVEDPGPEQGSYSPITDKAETIGFALRTKARTLPVFISPGNLLSLENSLQLAKQSIGSYRIPEPTRLAHETVNSFRTGKIKEGYTELETQGELLF